MRHESVKEVSSYKFTSKDKLYLDANIWLYLHGPQQPQATYVNTYSNAYKRILSAQSPIYIDALVVSEFINRYARMQWKLHAPNFEQFKDFRDSPFFKLHARNVVADAKLIVKQCSAIESGFEKVNIDTLLDTYATGGYDFNDLIISELCKREGLILVTHDGDFRDPGLSVLTANRSLLR